MNCLLVFLIFSGVIATGSARKCMTCQVFGIGNDDCTGDLEECENDDDFCVKQIEYSLIGVMTDSKAGYIQITIRPVQQRPTTDRLVYNKPVGFFPNDPKRSVLSAIAGNTNHCILPARKAFHRQNTIVQRVDFSLKEYSLSTPPTNLRAVSFGSNLYSPPSTAPFREYKDGDDRATVRKRCMSSANEDVCRTEPMKLDCKKMRFFLYSECCYEDGCNSDKIQMPAENTTKNGHQCPTCFVENKDACPKAKLEDCTGNANICLDFKGDVTRPEDVKKRYAFKGCADKHLCETDLSKLPGCKVGNDATLTCT